jgi:hypothetical protein
MSRMWLSSYGARAQRRARRRLDARVTASEGSRPQASAALIGVTCARELGADRGREGVALPEGRQDRALPPGLGHLAERTQRRGAARAVAPHEHGRGSQGRTQRGRVQAESEEIGGCVLPSLAPASHGTDGRALVRLDPGRVDAAGAHLGRELHPDEGPLVREAFRHAAAELHPRAITGSSREPEVHARIVG